MALAACASGGGGLTGACPGPAIGEVPMVPVGSSWVVPVKINGADWGMTLDTGSSRNLLARSAVTQLGLTPYGEYESVTGGVSGYKRGKLVEVGQFAFAGVGLHGLLMPVSDYQPPKFDLLPMAGLLGMSNLWVFDLQFDFPGQTLRLYNRATCEGPKPDWAGDYTTVPMHTVSGGRNSKPNVDVLTASNNPKGSQQPDVARMLLEVTVNGHAFTALLDTGAYRTLLFADAAALAGLGTGGQAGHASDALGNAINVTRIEGNTVRVGTMTWTDVPLDITPERLEYGVDMLFGQDLMRTRKVWAMLGAKKLFLQRA